MDKNMIYLPKNKTYKITEGYFYLSLSNDKLTHPMTKDEFTIFNDKHYTENRKMVSKIAIKENTSVYRKTVHIVISCLLTRKRNILRRRHTIEY